MSWYELLLTLHILAVALWFGSGLALTVLSYRLLRADPPAFGPFAVHAGWWAGRAHPAAGVVIILTGFGLVAEADLSLGEPWISIALAGWIVLMAIGGALTGPTATRLNDAVGGGHADEAESLSRRLLLLMRAESVLLALVIVDMVVKPG